MRLQHGLRLPDFIGIGPPRTATTWLNGVLSARVGLPANVKETDFFSYRYDRGLAWYAEHFRHCAATPVVGEFSPNYFHSRNARERIRHHLPEVRIICTLRDPVARLYSHYRLKTRMYSRKISLVAALNEDPDLIAASQYASHLAQWLEAFGKQNVLAIMYDQLKTSPQQYVNSVCGFLGIESIDVKASPATHRPSLKNVATHAPRRAKLAAAANRLKLRLQMNGYRRTAKVLRKIKVWHWCTQAGDEFLPMARDLEARLRDRFRPDVEWLEELLNCDLTPWKVQSYGG